MNANELSIEELKKWVQEICPGSNPKITNLDDGVFTPQQIKNEV